VWSSTAASTVVLGGGKRLFEGFSSSLDLEHLGVRQSQYATFIDFRISGSDGFTIPAYGKCVPGVG
jgi:hypothetical protein